MELTDKHVVLTGGLGGIGFECSKLLVKGGVLHLAILDVIENPAALNELKALNPKCELTHIKFDITDKTSVQLAIAQAAARLKYFDILINGAGILSDRNVEQTINVNLTGLILTTLEALPFMDKTQKGRGGVIMNLASITGLNPCPAICVYSASKFGVVGFTRCLADPFYYDTTGVAVMAVNPGVTATALVQNLDGKDTFDISKPLTEKFFEKAGQTAEKCAENLIKCLCTGKNGNLWILDNGSIKQVTPTLF